MADPADKDPRNYIKVHNGMPEHPKVEGLSDAAFRLLVTTWCWSDRNNTDGAVLEKSRRKRGTPKAWRELLDAGLAEPAEDGVAMHDYLEHQRSAEEKRIRSEKARAAGSAGGKAKASALANAKQMLQQPLQQMPSETRSESVAELEKELDLSYVGREGGGSVPRELQAHPAQRPSGNCPDHPRGTTDPCGGCGRAGREVAAWDAEERRLASAAASMQAQERAKAVRAAIDACQLCGPDGYRTTTDGTRGPHCDHIHRQPGALARARAAVAQPESRTA